jgi:mono/diheme cytochrome c family protein
MAAQYRIYQVVTRSGETIRGTALNQDTYTVQMRDANGNLRGFVKADLKESGYVASPMPSFKEKLTPQEVADVVSYLISLR